MPGWGSTSPGLQAPSALKKRSCSSPALRAFMMPLLLTTSPLDTRHVSVPEQRHSQPSPPFKCKWAPSASSSGITSFQKGGGRPGTLLGTNTTNNKRFFLAVCLAKEHCFAATPMLPGPQRLPLPVILLLLLLLLLVPLLLLEAATATTTLVLLQ